jgi:hypothetical protein
MTRRLNVTLEDFLNVGAADATGGDFDEHFAGGEFGDGYLFDAHDSLFAVDARAHGFRDGARDLWRFQHALGMTHRLATC